MLPKLINKELAEDIAVVVIFLGANDSNRQDLNPLQYVPIEEYRENMKKIVDIFQVGLKL